MSSQEQVLDSSTRINPAAVVHPDACLGENVSVGAYSIIGPRVTIGADCEIGPHAVIQGPAIIGERNRVFPFAVIGSDPQHQHYDGEPTTLEIGNDNVFREYVTVNRGTEQGGGKTVIGDSNFLMAYVHVAHDCRIGSRVIMANQVTLAGHVTVEDHAVFGGLAAVGQFLRVGESAMVSAGAMVERHVPPFCMVQGDRAKIRGLNLVGLSRRGIPEDEVQSIKKTYRSLFYSGKPFSRAVQELMALPPSGTMARRLLTFVAETAEYDSRGECA